MGSFYGGTDGSLPEREKAQAFQGTGDGAQMPLGQMQVFRRRFQIAVAQQNLNGAQIRPRFQ